MSVDHHFTHLTTEELVKRFRVEALQGQSSKELIVDILTALEGR